MKNMKTIMIVIGSLVLTVLLGVAGCGDDHRDHMRSDRDHYPEHSDRHDSDRH